MIEPVPTKSAGNQLRLWFSSIAYVLMNALRQQCLAKTVVVVESGMLPQLEKSPTVSEKAIEVNSRLKQNEQTSTSNATEQQPVGEEVSMLAEKLKSATSYYQIRSAIYRHLAVKDEACQQLTPEEQLRIERLLPQEVLALKTAI